MYSIILFSFFGAAFQEVLHWYTLREKLDDEKYKKLMSSIGYWVVTILMISLTPIAVYALTNGNVGTPISWVFIAGAGAPLIVKKGVEVIAGTMSQQMLGPAEKSQTSIRDYFT